MEILMNTIDKKFTLLVDMDDTIENLVPAWTEWLNRYYGTAVSRSDCRQWNMQAVYPLLSSEQVFEPLGLDEFWKTVTPKPDAQKYLAQLYSEGFPIYIVTASHPNTIKAKVKYVLNEYFPYIDHNHIITCAHKQMVSGWYLIDDGAHNFGGNYKGILMDAPWNWDFDNDSQGIFRAYNWEQIYNKIHEEYENEK